MKTQISISPELRDTLKDAKGDKTYTVFLLELMDKMALNLMDELSGIKYLPGVGAATAVAIDPLKEPTPETPAGDLTEVEAVQAIVEVLGDKDLIDDCRRNPGAAYVLTRAREALFASLYPGQDAEADPELPEGFIPRHGPDGPDGEVLTAPNVEGPGRPEPAALAAGWDLPSPQPKAGGE